MLRNSSRSRAAGAIGGIGFGMLLLSATAPLSAATAANYVAIPERAPAAGNVIVRDQMWRCDAQGNCRGPAATGSRQSACALAVRQFGRLTSFTANGVAIDEAALARCNRRA